MNMTKQTMILASLLFATSAMSIGCFNFASLQGPEVLNKGETRKGIGLTLNSYRFNVDSNLPTPAVNVWYRRGIASNLEAHALVWLPLGATVGLKYQLVGERGAHGLSVSMGLDLGYFAISSGDGDTELSDTYFDSYVPLYVGYRPSDSVMLYAVPKYVLRFHAPSDEASSFDHVVGAALGIGIGASSTFYLEGAALHSMNEERSSLMGAIGYAF